MSDPLRRVVESITAADLSAQHPDYKWTKKLRDADDAMWAKALAPMGGKNKPTPTPEAATAPKEVGESSPSPCPLRKFWVHPAKGEVHEFSPDMSHQEFVRDHSAKLGISKDRVKAFGDEERAGGSDEPYYEKVAFDRGWARAYRVSGSSQVHDHIAIEHRGDLGHVSDVVKTLAAHGIAQPHHQIHIENNYGSPLGAFASPSELHHAAVHGGQMGPIVRGRINAPDTVPHHPHAYESSAVASRQHADSASSPMSPGATADDYEAVDHGTWVHPERGIIHTVPPKMFHGKFVAQNPGLFGISAARHRTLTSAWDPKAHNAFDYTPHRDAAIMRGWVRVRHVNTDPARWAETMDVHHTGDASRGLAALDLLKAHGHPVSGHIEVNRQLDPESKSGHITHSKKEHSGLSDYRLAIQDPGAYARAKMRANIEPAGADGGGENKLDMSAAQVPANVVETNADGSTTDHGRDVRVSASPEAIRAEMETQKRMGDAKRKAEVGKMKVTGYLQDPAPGEFQMTGGTATTAGMDGRPAHEAVDLSKLVPKKYRTSARTTSVTGTSCNGVAPASQLPGGKPEMKGDGSLGESIEQYNKYWVHPQKGIVHKIISSEEDNVHHDGDVYRHPGKYGFSQSQVDSADKNPNPSPVGPCADLARDHGWVRVMHHILPHKSYLYLDTPRGVSHAADAAKVLTASGVHHDGPVTVGYEGPVGHSAVDVPFHDLDHLHACANDPDEYGRHLMRCRRQGITHPRDLSKLVEAVNEADVAKVKLKEKELVGKFDGMPVYLVSDAEVRTHIVDYAGGGNPMRYRSMPDEIWVGKSECPVDQAMCIAHEIVEYLHMRYGKESYAEAHKHANEVELILRQVVGQDNAKLEGVLDAFADQVCEDGDPGGPLCKKCGIAHADTDSCRIREAVLATALPRGIPCRGCGGTAWQKQGYHACSCGAFRIGKTGEWSGLPAKVEPPATLAVKKDPADEAGPEPWKGHDAALAHSLKRAKEKAAQADAAPETQNDLKQAEWIKHVRRLAKIGYPDAPAQLDKIHAAAVAKYQADMHDVAPRAGFKLKTEDAYNGRGDEQGPGDPTMRGVGTAPVAADPSDGTPDPKDLVNRIRMRMGQLQGAKALGIPPLKPSTLDRDGQIPPEFDRSSPSPAMQMPVDLR